MMRILLVCITICSVPLCVAGQERAPQELVDKALDGDDVAQNSLGLFYKQNNDIDNAVVWFKKAAAKDNPAAMLNLGSLFLEQGNTDSKYWYLRAAEKEMASAYRGLGLYYDQIEKDESLSIKWHEKAADNGDLVSQRILGDIYRGKGNVELAVRWYSKSVDNGNITAMGRLGELYLSLKQYSDAFSWYMKSAVSGDATSQCQIGYMYAYGQGVDINHKEARYWMQRSAEGGYAQAQFNLGLFYSRGSIGLPKDDDKAFDWFLKAANQGRADAQNNVAIYYYRRKQNDKAEHWWRLAADKGNVDAKKNLRQCLGIIYQ